MKAIDVANYTAVPTPQQVRDLLADGWQTAIVGCSYGSVATQQLNAFADGGMDVEAYAFIEFRDGWEAAIDRALAALTSAVRRLWLDCEETSPLDVFGIIQRIHDAIAYVRARRPDLELGIYTGGWWWMPGTNDSHEFADLPLWTAEYDSRIVSPTMYGGWSMAAIWQYQGSVDTCGLNTDRNMILEQEDEMPVRVWCSDRLQTWIVGKFGAAPVAYPVDDAIWIALYGPHARAMTGAELDALVPK